MTTLLPPNATALEKSLETVKSEAFGLPVNIPSLWNPEKCPIELLPYLAWSMGLDSWSDSWPENVRRARVAAAIEISRHKGTAKSVRDVVASFGGAVVLREWFETTPRGNPHNFDLVITIDSQTAQAPTAAFVDAVIAEVARVKPVRSHFTFTQGIDTAAQAGEIGYLRPVVSAHLITEEAA